MDGRRRIFLAHAREDKAQVRRLYEDLKSEGFDPWLDEEDLIPGQNWRAVIPGVIRDAAIFVACLSSRSVGRQGFVHTELRTALSAYGERPPGTVYIIPVKLDNCEIPDLQIPNQGTSLRDLHWIELSQEGGYRHLLRGLRHGLGVGPDERREPVPQPADVPTPNPPYEWQQAALRRDEKLTGEAAALLVELKWPETTHQRRIEIGRRLDEIGDPRPGIVVDAHGTPEIDWCRVPGGNATIKDDAGVPRRKRIDPFHIARVPVTVAQYRAFLNAEDGWHKPDWWVDDLDHEPNGDIHDVRPFGNNPVVLVNWFDAMAFCRWLSRRLGFSVRLPDEWEWQHTATGGDAGHTFPWGSDLDPKQEPHRANTWESKLQGPTAVGMYPAGATPQGVLDMAGTVFEWCLNKYGEPHVTKSEKGDLDSRAVRGGSWDDDLVYARCGFRMRLNPAYRFNYVGFRVMCLSPILDY